jgi:hypothetical protein
LIRVNAGEQRRRTALVVIALMLVLGVVTWEDLTKNAAAWNTGGGLLETRRGLRRAVSRGAPCHRAALDRVDPLSIGAAAGAVRPNDVGAFPAAPRARVSLRHRQRGIP